MTTIKIGNLFESSAHTLVNTVNCVGVMGKGIALEFKKRHPAMFADYVVRCQQEEVKLGEPYHYADLIGTSIVNFPTKAHWRSASRLVDIEAGLDYFVAHYEEWGIESIAFPPLGCGNGGLSWVDVGPLMFRKLGALPIAVEIYAPYGTPIPQLSAEFLDQATAVGRDLVGKQLPNLKDEWLALFEVVYQLSHQPYAKPVGRTIFQKISYIMTELGVETGFIFKQGSYGPFSAEVQEALTVAANTNLIQEKQLGPMTALVTTDEYSRLRKTFHGRIAPFQKWIDKTVDLFSRIKNTAQAEEAATVIYATRHLKSATESEDVSEQSVFDFIMSWKKAWQNEIKQGTVASTIRNLQMLGWIKLQYSETLPYQSF